jgi:hypothetical protein
MSIRPLPPAVQQLTEQLRAPPRLVAHLQVVHDAAGKICDGLHQVFPTLVFDEDAILFGAATHDIGKVRHPDELSGPGNQHEIAGEILLIANTVSPQLARFARTHGCWAKEQLTLEDMVVALADCIWKGQRIESLENQIVERITGQNGESGWQVFAKLDTMIEKIVNHCATVGI